ncbi:MAG: hypothetical protein LIP12_14385 [Clostridiales bacterium]|nr:hypothetical protein [Clostridiales bacterium]
MYRDSTTDLETALGKTRPDEMETWLKAHQQSLADEAHPFAAYMRELFKQKTVTQQEVFLKADIPERYGYRLIAQAKKTAQRDIVLRICFAAGFTLKEAQRALKLYGMSELYARIPRDAALIVAFNNGVHEVEEVNEMLVSNGLDPLKPCGSRE